MPAAATLDDSLGLALAQFGAVCRQAAADATALTDVVYGLADGNDYGRYFYGQDPLVTYQVAAPSLGGLIAQSSAQQANVIAAIEAAMAEISDIGGFAIAIGNLTEAVRLACANPDDAVRILTGMAQFAVQLGSLTVPTSDTLGAQISFLTMRAVLLIRVAAAGSLIIASSTYQPTSQQDAGGLRDQISDVLDNLELICGDLFDDVTMMALEAGRVAVVEDMNQRGANLAPILVRQVQRASPAKILAYRFYADTTRAGDLVARNNPPHPAFMPFDLETLAY